MNLKNKLKEASKAIILSSAIISAVGCATATPWQRISVNEKPTGVERTVINNLGSKKIKERSFNISDPYIENDVYKNRITESANEATYIFESKDIQREVQRIAVEQRTNEEMANIFATAGVVVGMIGGGYIGGGDDPSNPENTLGVVLGAGLGALVGCVGGAMLGSQFTQIETRENNLGNGEISIAGKIEERISGRRLLYSDQLARGVKFRMGEDQTIYLTDSNGNTNWVYNEKNEASTREGLERKLYDIPIVQQIKPATREKLRKRLLGAISEATEEVTIETREKPANDLERVQNCSKRVVFNYFELEDRAVYNIVSQFVDEEINSSMRTLKFRVKDDLTHVPIGGSNFEIATKVPSKSELAGKYFTGELMSYAETMIEDYLYGSSIVENCSDEVEFRVYSPSNLSLEITNPDYNFFAGQIAIKGNANKTIYMIDKGTKIRIEQQGKSVGRMEDTR